MEDALPVRRIHSTALRWNTASKVWEMASGVLSSRATSHVMIRAENPSSTRPVRTSARDGREVGARVAAPSADPARRARTRETIRRARAAASVRIAVRAATRGTPQGTRTSGATTPAPAMIATDAAGASGAAVRSGRPDAAVVSRPGRMRSPQTVTIRGTSDIHTNRHIIR